MNPSEFDENQRQHLLPIGDDVYAFVPPPLPPQIDTSQLLTPLTNAAAAVGELNGVARRLQNPYMLIGPLLRREALTSSAMEGTITTLGDMLLEEAGEEPASRDDAREATNYTRAIHACTELIDTMPISHRVIKKAHAILLSGLSAERGARKRPGEYKDYQNAVGRRGDTIATARYVPPPPAQTQTCMDQLEAYINRSDSNPAHRLIDLAITHYQFEAIHPFADGNGRVGRMLITLLAKQDGLLDLPVLHVSAYLESQKDKYVDKLFRVSTHAAWDDWIIFFLQIVERCAVDAVQVVDRIISLQAELIERVQVLGKTHHRYQTIINSLFDHPATTAKSTQSICNVTFPTAQSDLRALVKAGILREFEGTKSRVYYAPEILALSERPPAPPPPA